MKRINLTTLLVAQEAWDEEEAIGSSSALPPIVEPTPPPYRVTRTGSLYNPTCPSSHSSIFKWFPLVICDSIRRSYPDAVLWPASTTHCTITSQVPRLFTPWFPCFSIHIDPLTNKADNNMEIKAALPEEFSRKTRDANRWLMAMEDYFAFHTDKYPNEVWTMVCLNRMSKGQEKAFDKAWLIKLKNKCITDADKTWTKIKKAFKAVFTPYNTAMQAWVALTLLNQDRKNPLGFNKYISSFSLLCICSGITDYHALSEWFLHSLDPQITVQLTLSGAVKTSTTIKELYSKASEIEGSYCHITSLRRGP